MPDRQRVKTEIHAFGKLFAALATMKRKDRVSEYDVMVYEERTAHIPMSILSKAVAKILDTQSWFPTVAELLDACEKARVELRAAVKFQPCGDCTNGWATVSESDGIRRLKRCNCWMGHQQRVEQLGIPSQPLALPAAEERESE